MEADRLSMSQGRKSVYLPGGQAEWAGNEIMKYLLTDYRGAGPTNDSGAGEKK